MYSDLIAEHSPLLMPVRISNCTMVANGRVSAWQANHSAFSSASERMRERFGRRCGDKRVPAERYQMPLMAVPHDERTRAALAHSHAKVWQYVVVIGLLPFGTGQQSSNHHIVEFHDRL